MSENTPSTSKIAPAQSGQLKFYKYSLYGNNFVVLDYDENTNISQSILPELAKTHTTIHFGVGCDNLIVFKKLEQSTLNAIQEQFEHWSAPKRRDDLLQDHTLPHFIFRMFESTGVEADCCGNALLCLSFHLFRQKRIKKSWMLTEVPNELPVQRLIQYEKGVGEVKIGQAKRLSPKYFNPAPTDRIRADPLQACREHDRCTEIDFADVFRWRDKTTTIVEVSYTAYLTHTGEPHMVIFDLATSSVPGFLAAYENLLPTDENTDVPPSATTEPTLLQAIGLSINSYSHFFPEEISLNIARVLGPNTIAYRTFERGILKETYACGTGAVAVANIAQELGLVEKGALNLLPCLARTQPKTKNACLRLETDAEQSWYISAKPILICEGNLSL